MKIKKRRINSLNRILAVVDDKDFKIIAYSDNSETLNKIGLKNGDEDSRIIPNAIGPVTRFNLNGKELIDKSEREVITRELPYNVVDWHGYPHSGTYTREYNRYKRIIVAPTLININLKKMDDDSLIISSDILKPNDDPEKIKTTINIMLEIFGEIELVDSDNNPLLLHKNVPWKILPPGKYPWDIFRNHIGAVRRKVTEEEFRELEERYKFIESLNPSEVFTGTDGFFGYYIAKFNNNLYVCDSMYFGNAIYVLDKDWDSISKLTKRQIIKGKLAIARIPHTSNWKNNLLKYIKL